MLGGRAAEELVFHDPTTGAANDIEKATAVARAMVTQYGMTERLGAIRYGKENGEVFLGRDMGHVRDYSEDIAAVIDEEVRSLIDHAHNEAFEILVDNRDVLDRLVIELLEKETLNKEQVAAIFTDLRLRPTRPAWTGSERRTPSDRPPVDVPEREAVAASTGPAYGIAAPAYGVPAAAGYPGASAPAPGLQAGSNGGANGGHGGQAPAHPAQPYPPYPASTGQPHQTPGQGPSSGQVPDSGQGPASGQVPYPGLAPQAHPAWQPPSPPPADPPRADPQPPVPPTHAEQPPADPSGRGADPDDPRAGDGR